MHVTRKILALAFVAAVYGAALTAAGSLLAALHDGVIWGSLPAERFLGNRVSPRSAWVSQAADPGRFWWAFVVRSIIVAGLLALATWMLARWIGWKAPRKPDAAERKPDREWQARHIDTARRSSPEGREER